MPSTTLIDAAESCDTPLGQDFTHTMRAAPPSIESKLAVALFSALLTLYIGWIFLLPAFPTQDGPVHLYYAHVLSDLMSRHPSYSHFFYVQHWFPPYALHTYVLLGLLKLFAPLMAEKVMTAITVACSAGGVFFLMRSLQRGEPILSSLAVPLSLNWAVFMGFYNYVLALGLMFFAIGAWYRGCSLKSTRYFAGYLLLLATIAVTHPVPLLMVLLVCGLDFMVTFGRNLLHRVPIRAMRQELVVTALSGLPAIYVALFVDPAVSGITGPGEYKLSLATLFRGAYVSPFRGSKISSIAYSSAIESVVVLCCIAAFIRCTHALRQKRLWGIESLFLVGFGFFIAVPFLPFTANGGYFLGPRFAVAGLLLLLVAGNAAIPARPQLQRLLLFGGLGAAIVALGILHTRISPIADDMAAMKPIPIAPSTLQAVLMTDGVEKVPDLSFRPYYWAGARSLLDSNAVILNSPWLFSPFAMLASKPPVMNYSVANEPVQVPLLMKWMSSYREQIQSTANATFIGSTDTRVREFARTLALGAAKTSCQSSDWYEMCIIDSGAATATPR